MSDSGRTGQEPGLSRVRFCLVFSTIVTILNRKVLYFICFTNLDSFTLIVCWMYTCRNYEIQLRVPCKRRDFRPNTVLCEYFTVENTTKASMQIKYSSITSKSIFIFSSYRGKCKLRIGQYQILCLMWLWRNPIMWDHAYYVGSSWSGQMSHSGLKG